MVLHTRNISRLLHTIGHLSHAFVPPSKYRHEPTNQNTHISTPTQLTINSSNAGGGGERVLWAAIRATQIRYPGSLCAVYTGDHDVDKAAILLRVKERFNINLHAPSVTFVYLSKRHYVLSTTWPHFTLLGQSLGSLVLGWEALTTLVPDIFIDTMGYAFILALSKFLFPSVPTGAYVHYPTISTDMLGSLDEDGQGVNAGAGKGLRGSVKRTYWELFAKLYGWVGSRVDVVMTNSSWTQAHVRSLWGKTRRTTTTTDAGTDISVVFPPVAVEEVAQAVAVNAVSESQRSRALLYIAQFRPEKNHTLILDAFAKLVNGNNKQYAKGERPRLVLVGSVRNDDDSRFIYKLRLLVNELHIKEDVEFILNAPWPDVLAWLRRAWVGVNGMWNEHFGIGVVEYQAAGLIAVVNNSGGPKEDIVVEIDGKPTG